MNRRRFAAILLLCAAGLIGFRGVVAPPAGPLRVLIVEEARNRGTLSTSQQAIILGTEFSDAIKAKKGELRIIDKDATAIPINWQPLFVGDPAMVPRMAVARGTEIKVGPLPKTVEAATAAIQ